MISIPAKKHSLTDALGRRISYLRLSVTENCNFNCGYCGGSSRPDNDGIKRLTDNEIIKVIKAVRSLGIDKVRFTGGEPLLRQNLDSIIREISSYLPGLTIGITTNGFLLDRYLNKLIDSGLNRLNISLDTLNRDTFRSLTGVDGLARVLMSIDNAIASEEFQRIKINTVVLRGINDSEIRALAEWALSRPIELRFIEYMPLDGYGETDSLHVPESEIKKRVGLPLTDVIEEVNSPGPVNLYSHENSPGRIGFISAVSRCFCGSCNRLRITSRGDVYGCLFGKGDSGLRDLLLRGAGEADIAEYLERLVVVPGFRRTPGASSMGESNRFMRSIGG